MWRITAEGSIQSSCFHKSHCLRLVLNPVCTRNKYFSLYRFLSKLSVVSIMMLHAMFKFAALFIIILLGCFKFASLDTSVSHNSNSGDPSQFIPSLGDTSPGSVWPQPQVMKPTSVVRGMFISLANFLSDYFCVSVGLKLHCFIRQLIFITRGS